MYNIKNKIVSCVLVILTVFSVSFSRIGITVSATSDGYQINNKIVNCRSVDDTGNDSSGEYAQKMYEYIWDEKYNTNFSEDNNILKTFSKEELILNPQNLKAYVTKAKLGAVLRISDASSLYGKDTYGYSLIIVQKDEKGFTAVERSNKRTETYYTWDLFCSTYGCDYIKYIKEPTTSESTIYSDAEEDSYKVPERTLSYTDPLTHGYDVCWVQNKLSKLGYDVTVDGYYGESTENAVENFQKDYKLDVTGKVGDDTVNKLENPIAVPDIPSAKLTSSKNISVGQIASIEWEKAAGAETYTASVYNSKNVLVDSIKDIDGTQASFKLDKPEIYTFKVKSVNSEYESEQAVVSDRVTVRSDIVVTFTDSDGTILSKQTIAYGGDAVTPASPKKNGYTFTGWDKEYENLKTSTTVRATYSKKTYTVNFLDYEGNTISTQKVKYGNAATEPSVNIPSGYTFVGWDNKFNSITKNQTVKMIVVDNNEELPIAITSCTGTRAEEKSGYTVSVDITNSSSSRIGGRIVASLKTKNGKFLTMTESSAFSLKASESKSLDVFVPYEGAASLAEVYIVKTYSTLLPISESRSVSINTDNDWTGWLTEAEKPDVTYNESEPRTEYRYRTKAFTTSNKNTLAGWDLYNTTWAWSDYIGWSGWSTTRYTSSDSRKVESKSETFISSYTMNSYCTQNAYSPYYRQYRDYSINRNYGAYGCRSSYGEFGRSTVWSVATHDGAARVGVGTYSNRCNYAGYNKGNKTGFASGDFMWFEQSVNRSSRTYYRYNDRYKVYTYHYSKWNEWSDWSTTSTEASDNVQVETRETKRYLANDPTEDDTGVQKTITGVLGSSFAGKQATLFVYKIDDASDYTNEYVGQTEIDEDGRYVFTFKMREEPSVKTGDFKVALGIEGSNSIMYLDPIKAPKPEYTVNICDYDGTIIDTQKVEEGESAVLPETAPERKGWTFAGWDYSNASVYEDINITALYVQNTYTVAYIDWMHQTYDVMTYNYGDPIVAPQFDDVEGGEALGWDKIIEGIDTVTENMVLTAKYDSQNFTVDFYDYEGNKIDSQTVAYGGAVKAPQLESTDKYVFLSWDCSSDMEDVKSNLEVHPEYKFANTTETPVASVESGVYDDTVSVSLSCSTENSIIYYSTDNVEFNEYTEPLELSKTTELYFYASAFGYNDSKAEKSYYAINKGTDVSEFVYPVSVYSNDQISNVYLIKNGDALSEEMAKPTMKGYTFDGYYLDKEFTQQWDISKDTVTKAQNLYIKWKPETFNVKFVYENGDEISTQQVDYMNSATVPENVKVDDGYVLVGWDTDKYLSVTSDITVTAIIKSEEDVATISLDKNSIIVMKGLKYQFQPTILPADNKARTIVWSSSDDSIVTVDTNGEILAKKAGNATIKAYLPDSGVYAECTVKVTHNKSEEICLVSKSDYTIVEGALFGISCSSNTVSEVSDQIDAEKLIFKNNDGVQLTSDEKVGTGYKIYLSDASNELIDEVTAVVTGDVNGDGYVNNKDVSKFSRMLVEKDTFSIYEKMAADVNADGVVNNRDASLLSRYLVGKEKI